MLEYIRGTLIETTPLKAIVEVRGLGYSLHIHLATYSKLSSIGSEVLLYISTVIREDAHKLYAFLSKEERDLFEKLNEISGIGPKTSLALLGHMDRSDLQLAISAGNIPLLSKIPGIGKKTAERLIVEMRDKIASFGKEEGSMSLPSSGGNAADAIQALVHLGYNPLHAQKAVKKIIENATQEHDLPALITAALRTL